MAVDSLQYYSVHIDCKHFENILGYSDLSEQLVDNNYNLDLADNSGIADKHLVDTNYNSDLADTYLADNSELANNLADLDIDHHLNLADRQLVVGTVNCIHH